MKNRMNRLFSVVTKTLYLAWLFLIISFFSLKNSICFADTDLVTETLDQVQNFGDSMDPKNFGLDPDSVGSFFNTSMNQIELGVNGINEFSKGVSDTVANTAGAIFEDMGSHRERVVEASDRQVIHNNIESPDDDDGDYEEEEDLSAEPGKKSPFLKVKNSQQKMKSGCSPASRVRFASWYGPGFQNHPTATGVRFNKYLYTAAMLYVPIPSVACVCDLDGNDVQLIINDRGPYSGKASIDLSQASMIALVGKNHSGRPNKGRVRVKVSLGPCGHPVRAL